MTKQILKLENVSHHCNKEFQSTTAKKLYLFEINSRFTFESHDAFFFFLQLPGLPCMNYEIVIHKAWGP